MAIIGFTVMLLAGIWFVGGSLYMTWFAFQISGGVNYWGDVVTLCIMFLFGVFLLVMALTHMPFTLVIL